MKHKHINLYQITGFILIFVILAQILCSCSSPADNSTETPLNDENNADDTGADTPDTTELSDDIPPLDFKGEEISVLYGDYVEYEIYAETENGEPVNDSVYRRNSAIEERFNVNFKMIPTPGA